MLSAQRQEQEGMAAQMKQVQRELHLMRHFTSAFPIRRQAHEQNGTVDLNSIVQSFKDEIREMRSTKRRTNSPIDYRTSQSACAEFPSSRNAGSSSGSSGHGQGFDVRVLGGLPAPFHAPLHPLPLHLQPANTLGLSRHQTCQDWKGQLDSGPAVPATACDQRTHGKLVTTPHSSRPETLRFAFKMVAA